MCTLRHRFTAPPLHRATASPCRGHCGRDAGGGIRLALARDLVSAHEGRIRVAANSATGNRFTVWLPILHAPAVEENASTAG